VAGDKFKEKNTIRIKLEDDNVKNMTNLWRYGVLRRDYGQGKFA